MMLDCSSNWPPDYDEEFLRRANILETTRKGPELAIAYYSDSAVNFINDWCFTFDPRKSGSGIPASMPFRMFQRQEEMVLFFQQLIEEQCSGLIEKCRDMGATWTAAAFAVWLWRFRAGASIGFGSRKEMLVDRLGDMDSIFEKIRFIIKMLPAELLPAGFSLKDHSTYMKLLNPENNSSITGEAGDNIGRGGRKLIYFKDESAHYDHPELIEAALMDNTNIQVDISSVNGTGNVFHRRRMNGEVWQGTIEDRSKTQVFVMEWRDHPLKDDAWHAARKQKAEDDGLVAEFEQEVERNYSSSVLGTVIKAEWVEAAIGLAEDFELDVSGKKIVALDVADDGISGDKNAISYMHGLELKAIDSWGQVDTDITAKKAYSKCVELGCKEIHYDSIGVGAGVKGSFNSMKREGTIPKGFKIVPWVASGAVVDPWGKVTKSEDPEDQGPVNRDFFGNFKAQAWWIVRNRFYQSYKCREGMDYDKDEVISLSRDIPTGITRQLKSELSQPTREETTSGKMKINKSPNGARSPNLADSFVMAACPAEESGFSTEEVSL
jgi:hypothetical protein